MMVKPASSLCLFTIISSSWSALLVSAQTTTSSATDDTAKLEAARRWVEEEFQPSTLSIEEQMAEMEWFIEAARPFRGLNVKVVSEIIDTHTYESEVMAQAFREITGINLVHELIPEYDVVDTLQRQFYTRTNFYDAYVSDSDLIGTHFRYSFVYPISEYMQVNKSTVLCQSFPFETL